ncbi:class I SAM-dependent methyltransferase [Pseudomonadales bacterium]|nr:class I SAM-dependent methyltransferase [Pseudomonadales bacterium]
MMKSILKKIPQVNKLIKNMDNLHVRTEWVERELAALPNGSKLLDAGCGNQQFRKFCNHLDYFAQDFGGYVGDLKERIGGAKYRSADDNPYIYGNLDFVGDIWSIDEGDGVFDVILCTEVLEHIPFPNETILEFSRLLKPGGKLLLTAPSNCLRHYDPYFFYTGFSDRWFERILSDNAFVIDSLEPIGDYYSWMSVEMMRTAKAHGLFGKLAVASAFLYFYTRPKNELSVNTLCMGYHIAATKKITQT